MRRSFQSELVAPNVEDITTNHAQAVAKKRLVRLNKPALAGAVAYRHHEYDRNRCGISELLQAYSNSTIQKSPGN